MIVHVCNFCQDVNSQTFSNSSQITALSQETTTATLSLSAAVAALAAGQLTQESPIIPASQPAVPSDNNNSVNQAWFTTKEDKDSLHGKGNVRVKKLIEIENLVVFWYTVNTVSLTQTMTCPLLS